MKFSHSIRLNAVPDWIDEYLDYSKLKDLLYSLEKKNLDSEAELEESSLLAQDTNPTFEKALDEQLNKVIKFYSKKETELKLKLEDLMEEVHRIERHYQQNLRQESLMSDMSPSIHARRQSASSDLGDQIEDEAETLIADHLTVLIWQTKSLKSERQRFQKSIIDLFVELNDLKGYVDINYTGFDKIIKKYDKVTGNRLRRVYMSSKVDKAYAFKTETREGLDILISRVISVYARLVTDGKMTLAAGDLNSYLRDYLVWERNTIWRDMIEQERRVAAVGIASTQNASILPDIGRIRCCGHNIKYPKLSQRSLMFGLSVLIFLGILTYPILPVIEQNHCFALLIFSSMLWAFELFPLFVTSILIPFLVVILGVLRDPITDHAGHVSYVRLDAKAASKRIFSEMFSPVIMLLLGGFTLAAALSKHQIAKNMAGFVLSKAGSQPHHVLLANMFVATFASMWISNVAAPVLCFSLISPILRNLPRQSPYAKSLILGIAMASNVGGMASPISSPQNIVALGNMTPAVSWLQWFMITLPCCIIIDLMIFALLLFVFEPAKGSRPHPPGLFSSTDRWESNPNQRFVMIVCFVTILLWCFESRLEGIVGDMGVIAILPMVLFFGTGILTKDDFNNFLWTVIMLAMGGISLGKAVQSSGLLNTITQMTMPLLNGLSSYACLLIVCAIVLIATTFISHTVGALILLPVIADIGQHLPDPQPRTLVMAAAMMCSTAMGLPVSSFPNMNAISLEDSTGVPWLTVEDFIKVGMIGSSLGYVCIVTLGFIIMKMIGFN